MDREYIYCTRQEGGSRFGVICYGVILVDLTIPFRVD